MLYADHGHYARVIMDVLYDHLLAKHWEDFHEQNLEDFAQTFFTEIEAQHELLYKDARDVSNHEKTKLVGAVQNS